jgi:hypothetical protein
MSGGKDKHKDSPLSFKRSKRTSSSTSNSPSSSPSSRKSKRASSRSGISLTSSSGSGNSGSGCGSSSSSSGGRSGRRSNKSNHIEKREERAVRDAKKLNVAMGVSGGVTDEGESTRVDGEGTAGSVAAEKVTSNGPTRRAAERGGSRNGGEKKRISKKHKGMLGVLLVCLFVCFLYGCVYRCVFSLSSCLFFGYDAFLSFSLSLSLSPSLLHPFFLCALLWCTRFTSSSVWFTHTCHSLTGRSSRVLSALLRPTCYSSPSSTNNYSLSQRVRATASIRATTTTTTHQRSNLKPSHTRMRMTEMMMMRVMI